MSQLMIVILTLVVIIPVTMGLKYFFEKNKPSSPQQNDLED